jgi:hypothetical protein
MTDYRQKRFQICLYTVLDPIIVKSTRDRMHHAAALNLQARASSIILRKVPGTEAPALNQVSEEEWKRVRRRQPTTLAAYQKLLALGAQVGTAICHKKH